MIYAREQDPEKRATFRAEVLQLRGTDIIFIDETVSKHLSILKGTGFIIEEKDGKWVNYMINPRPDDQRISSILSTLDFWIADQKIINEDKAKVTKVDRHFVCAK